MIMKITEKMFDNYLHIGYYIYTEVFKYNDSIRR